jgi:hypothetical protein
METLAKKVEFIKLETKDDDCRCCGKGRETFCDRCWDLFQKGYSIMIEVKDNSSEQKKKPTGYSIAVAPGLLYENGHPGVPIATNHLYFIRETDLKQFLGNGYNKTIPGRFLNGTPRWKAHGGNNSFNPRTTGSSRQAVELAHK